MNYLRRFAGWVTVLPQRYTSDVFFRTTLIISALEVFFFFCLAGFLLLGMFLGQVDFVWWSVVLVLVAAAALVALFGVVLARLALRPARSSLEGQKLFISNIAHELRTPLSVIKTIAEVELLETGLAPAPRKALNAIIEETNRASGVLNNVVSLNRLLRPQKPEHLPVDLGEIVDRVVARSGRMAFERGIEVLVSKAGGTQLPGNPVALEQLVINLVNNALRYTPKNGRGMVKITIRPDESGGLMFSVADNGIGIAKDDLAHILEPFYRGDKSRARNIKGEGTGLGLSIVNEIVRAHGGTIRINSTQGKGTNVTVRLPSGAR